MNKRNQSSLELIDYIDAGFYYAAKGLNDDNGQRITFGWISDVTDNKDEGKVLWAGVLGIPHLLTQNNGKSLAVYYPDSYKKPVLETEIG